MDYLINKINIFKYIVQAGHQNKIKEIQKLRGGGTHFLPFENTSYENLKCREK